MFEISWGIVTILSEKNIRYWLILKNASQTETKEIHYIINDANLGSGCEKDCCNSAFSFNYMTSILELHFYYC